MLVGAVLAFSELRLIIIAAVAGVAAVELVDWGDYLVQGLGFGVRIIPWSTPGNPVVHPLAPLLLAFTSSWLGAVPLAAYGMTNVRQFLVYFRKSWAFAYFAICLPAALLCPGPAKRRLTRFVVTSLVGVVVAGLSIRTVLGFGWVHQTTGVMGGVSRKVFHGELVRDDTGKVVSYMAWRSHLWQQAYEGFRAAPWIGQGFGPHTVQTQVTGEPAIVEGRWISGPHNSFLTVAFRSGILGIAPLASALLLALYVWARGRKRVPGLDVSFAAFLTAAEYALFNVCLENPQAGTWFWLFLGCVIGTGAGAFGATRPLPAPETASCCERSV